MSTKNPAAVALGQARWKGTSKKDRSEHMNKLRALSLAKMSKADLVARAKKASAAAAKARKRRKSEKNLANGKP